MALAEIAVGVGAFKTASEALKSLKDLVSSPDASAKIADIQSALIDAQQSAIDTQRAHSAQVDQIRALEAELRAYETWDAEKQRYELKDLGDGHFTNVLAYRLKEAEAGAEPPHSICPDCYQSRVKAILQKITRHPGMSHVMLCQICGWEGYTSGQWHHEHGGKSASRRTAR